MKVYHSRSLALEHPGLTAAAARLLQSLCPHGFYTVRIDRIFRIVQNSDHVYTVPGQTIEIWLGTSGPGERDPDEYFVCTDAGPVGGEVREWPNGIAEVDLGDGSRLNVYTGEITGCEYHD